jgi:hypothetical protein
VALPHPIERFEALVFSVSSGFDLVERSGLVEVNAYGLHNQDALKSVVLKEGWKNLLFFVYDIVLPTS